MESINTVSEMLELIPTPAFCVKDGIIVCVNQAASHFLIEPNTDVSLLLGDAREEYAAYTGGTMYLNLTLCGTPMGASVTEKAGVRVFTLHEDLCAPLQALALAARELRAPLSGIMTATDSLLQTPALSTLPGEQEQAARLNRELYRMLRIIGNMSDAARYSGTNGFRPELRDICAILDEILRRAEALCEGSGIHFQFTVPDQSLFCNVDEDLLERAVLNLVSNAIKFTPRDGRIECTAAKKGNKLHLAVSDTGSGIPPAILGSIFTRYQRAPSVEDGRHGIGLGLAIVCAAAGAHGGTVLIDQPGEQGTRVTMTLSLSIPEQTTLRSPVFYVDYAGERSHALIELSECLGSEHYEISKIN